MPLAVIEVLIKLGLWFFEWIVNKNANDEKLLAAFKEFSELARTANVRTIQQRSEAEKQIEQANKKWDQLEANEGSQSRHDGTH